MKEACFYGRTDKGDLTTMIRFKEVAAIFRDNKDRAVVQIVFRSAPAILIRFGHPKAVDDLTTCFVAHLKSENSDGD